ncbi:MAG: hypothetical protein DMG58_20785 [Acidobacteria bacterium]|nr:MAG: hypothetical protein DMG58_20785 [Acidobacteriota bacterium]
MNGGKIEEMRRLAIFLLATFTVVCFADSPKAPATPSTSTTVHGKLIQRENRTTAIEAADHKLIVLAGDEATVHVLHDKRLAGLDFEAKGHFTAADRFQVDPFYTRALYVIQDGKRLMVTYWCEICSIRQYEPGPCWCCQRETKLDLHEPDPE